MLVSSSSPLPGQGFAPTCRFSTACNASALRGGIAKGARLLRIQAWGCEGSMTRASTRGVDGLRPSGMVRSVLLTWGSGWHGVRMEPERNHHPFGKSLSLSSFVRLSLRTMLLSGARLLSRSVKKSQYASAASSPPPRACGAPHPAHTPPACTRPKAGLEQACMPRTSAGASTTPRTFPRRSTRRSCGACARALWRVDSGSSRALGDGHVGASRPPLY
jgi:hypothetical protein